MTNKKYFFKVESFKIKVAKMLVVVLTVLAPLSSTHAQSYQQYVAGEPNKNNFFSQNEFNVRMGSMSAGGGNSSATQGTSVTGSGESGLPFPVDKNYPDFYFIPSEKRPRVVNQGSCGSCVAWSTSTALASVLAIEGRYKTLIAGLHMPNAIQLFLLSGRMCQQSLPNYAWYTDKGVETLTQTGTHMSLTEPASNTGPFGASFATNVGDWRVKAGKSGTLTNKDAMRKFIANKGALVADFTVTEDFNKYSSGIYNHEEFVGKITKPLLLANQKAAADQLTIGLKKVSGGHAVTVIGYFKGGNLKLRDFMRPILPSNANFSIYGEVVLPNMPAYWIVQNSWGTGWGMNGLFYVAADQSYDVYYNNGKDRGRANTIDNQMYYMLEPRVTSNGKEIF